MIDAQSSALAAQFASLKGCRRFAGDNIHSHRPLVISRPSRTLERSSYFVDDRVLNLRQRHLHSARKSMFISVFSWLREMQHNPAILVYFPYHTFSHLILCGLVLCVISTEGSTFKLTQKSTRVSHCPSTALKVIKAKSHEKNSEFFFGHFYGKLLVNPAKTAKKTAQICAKNTRILTQKIRVLAQLFIAPTLQLFNVFLCVMNHKSELLTSSPAFLK